MGRCKAKTKDGTKCRNPVSSKKQYCPIHKNQDNSTVPALAIGGAILGNIIVPGIGGAIVGGIIGGLLGAKSKKDSDNE